MGNYELKERDFRLPVLAANSEKELYFEAPAIGGWASSEMVIHLARFRMATFCKLSKLRNRFTGTAPCFQVDLQKNRSNSVDF